MADPATPKDPQPSVTTTTTTTATAGLTAGISRMRSGIGDFVNILMLILLLELAGVILLCFFKKPLYENGAWAGVLTVSHLLTAVFGAMFGSAIPGISEGLGSGIAKVKRAITAKVICPFCGKSFDPKEGSNAKPDDPDG